MMMLSFNVQFFFLHSTKNISINNNYKFSKEIESDLFFFSPNLIDFVGTTEYVTNYNVHTIEIRS